MGAEDPNQIKAIIFDFGDVICFWDEKIIGPDRATMHGLPPDSIRETIFEYQRHGGEGKYHSIQDFLDRSDHQTPVTRDLAHQVFQEWEESGAVDARIVRLIEQLKPHYKIGLLSNYTKGLEEALLDKYKIHQLFDAVASSYTIKIRKPQPDAYHQILKLLEVQASQALFVDDKERNVVAAEAIGMQGIIFTGFEDLVEKLEAFLGGSYRVQARE